jgi:hypothetical protein
MRRASQCRGGGALPAMSCGWAAGALC